jgi:hypothetical protein
MTTSAERMKSPAGTEAPRTSDIHDWRERGRSPRDCGARLRRRRKNRPRSAGASGQPLHHRHARRLDRPRVTALAGWEARHCSFGRCAHRLPDQRRRRRNAPSCPLRHRIMLSVWTMCAAPAVRCAKAIVFLSRSQGGSSSKKVDAPSFGTTMPIVSDGKPKMCALSDGAPTQ